MNVIHQRYKNLGGNFGKLRNERDNVKPEKGMWVFVGDNSNFPSGIFTEYENAKSWIERYNLSGTLSIFPIDEGVFDWAIKNNALTIKDEKKSEQSNDPFFISSCLPASLDHYHFENGKRL